MRSSRDYWPWSNGTLPLNFLKIVDQLSSNEVSMQAVCKLTMICEINSMYHCHERPQTMQVRICHLYAVKTHWGVSHLRGLRGLKQEGTKDVKTSDLNFYFKIQSPSMDQAFFTSFPIEIARQKTPRLQGTSRMSPAVMPASLGRRAGDLTRKMRRFGAR